MAKTIDKEFECIDQIESEWSIISRYAPNILYVNYKPGEEELDVSFARKQTERVNKICKGEPHHIISDFSDTAINFSAEAREFFATNESHYKLRLSQVIIIKSLAHKLVANFYKRFNKPKSPTVIVSSLDQAIKWIKKQL